MNQTESQPLVSIVTPSYNSGEFIEQTIRSVLNQTYPNIEYIVMDGGSTDATVDILKSYHGQLMYVSEPDEGQSDAINKGWQRSNGEIVAWLCADDLYHPDAVQTAIRALNAHPEVGWVYGKAQRIDRQGRPYNFRHLVLPWDYQALLTQGNFINQPTVFLRREVIETMGYVRKDLYFNMDYEYWLRIGQIYKGLFLDQELALVHYYPGTKTASGGPERMREIEQVVAQYGGHTLPHGFRHDWTRIYLKQIRADLWHGRWAEFKDHTLLAARFPGHLPRAMMKGLLNLMPHELNRQLRRLL